MASSKPRAAIVHGQLVGPEKIQFAKLLRRTMTRPERLLWSALRRSQLDGLHFRRQQIAGDSVLDFYCDTARLAIELDGSSHDLRGERDESRDAELARTRSKLGTSAWWTSASAMIASMTTCIIV